MNMYSCSSFKITILIVISAACFSSSIISPCLPYISEYFNVETEQTSLLVSIFLFGYLGGQILYSFLSQIFGYKLSLLIGFFIYIISCFFQILSINHYYLNLLYYSRFFCALGASSGLVCSFAMINDSSENREETQKLISLAFISLTLFAYLSITFGGLITQYFGWIFIFYF